MGKRHSPTNQIKKAKKSNYLLYRSSERGVYKMNFNVDVGKKLVGKRVGISLQTYCVKDARARRDLILRALKAASLYSEEHKRDT